MNKISKKVLNKINEDVENTKDVILEVADESYNEIINTSNPSLWTNDCKNKKIKDLSIDERGRYGEHICKNVLLKNKNKTDTIEYFEGIQGDWDVKFNDIRIEVKTATLDKSGKFQNENIKKFKLHSETLSEGEDLKPYDLLVFIGVSPNNHLFKVVKYEDIPFDKLHNRGKAGTGASNKWDFNYNEYKLLINTKDLFDEIIKEASKKD